MNQHAEVAQETSPTILNEQEKLVNAEAEPVEATSKMTLKGP